MRDTGPLHTHHAQWGKRVLCGNGRALLRVVAPCKSFWSLVSWRLPGQRGSFERGNVFVTSGVDRSCLTSIEMGANGFLSFVVLARLVPVCFNDHPFFCGDGAFCVRCGVLRCLANVLVETTDSKRFHKKV